MTQPSKRYPFLVIPIIISVISLSLCAALRCDSPPRENAVEYRQKGYEAQKSGMLLEALSFYQKAIHTDPSWAAVYNDLGVVYEMLGQSADAERAYLKVVSIDPAYAKAYFNLAQMYEGRGDLLRASECWMKLMQTAPKEEPMLQKAENRICEIGRIFPEVRRRYLEAQISVLTNDVLRFKQRIASDNKALAQHYIERARAFFKQGDYAMALRLYLDARQLDPQNDLLDGLIEEAQRKLLLL